MGKAKRAEKKARKQARGTEQEAERLAREALAERARARKRLVLLLMPPFVVLVVVLLYTLAKEPQLAGIVGLAGAVIWFPLWLGTLGGEVRPRDRGRAGGIDFGRRG